jgi:hypothetical protein
MVSDGPPARRLLQCKREVKQRIERARNDPIHPSHEIHAHPELAF